MKRINIVIVSLSLMCALFAGCSLSKQSSIKEPELMQIRSICNLATLECYYHNVAKSIKKADTFLEKDRRFWIAYTGTAKVGIDMSDVFMEVDGTNIKVTLPEAKLLDVDIYERDLNEESYIQEGDGLFKNKITAQDQTEAIKVAQDNMANEVRNNKTLLINAQSRAQKLIEHYIQKIGEMSNVEYQIEWIYDDSNTDSPREETNTQEMK